MAELEYRRATERDAEAVAAVGAAVWDELGEKSGLPGRVTAEGVRARLAEWGDRGAMFLCDSEGAARGFASVQADVNHPSEAIMGVWLVRDARGKGIGTELALMATDFARGAGYRKIRGTIPEGNDPALSFFGEVASLAQVVGQGMEYELPL